MVSENKKRKQVNAYVIKTALKDKKWKCKRLMFYNSANRRELNKLAKVESQTEPKDIVVLHPYDINFVSEEAEKEYYESLRFEKED